MYVSKKNHIIYIHIQFIIIGKKFDTVQNNKILKSKISEIKYHSPNKKSPLMKSPINVYLNTSSNRKNKSKKYLQTNILRGKSFIDYDLKINLSLSKRINEKNSVYSLSKWKKDFKKSRIYKKISCEYPSINFVGKPKNKFKKNLPCILPKVDDNYNIFKGIKFKPFTSLIEDENTKRNDNSKKNSKRKKRHFRFLTKNNSDNRNEVNKK